MPDPNNVYLPEHGIGFFGICKNGNTSIKAAFLDSMGIRSQHRIHDNLAFHYVTGLELAEAQGIWTFAVKRDPLTRAMSAWKNKCHRSWADHYSKWGLARHMSFDAYVAAIAQVPDEELTGAGQHFRSQTYEFRDGWPDAVLPFEDLDEHWATVQHRSVLELPDLEHLNKMGIINPVVGAEALDKLVLRYQSDYKELGYAIP